MRLSVVPCVLPSSVHINVGCAVRAYVVLPFLLRAASPTSTCLLL